ncbi:helix-turn-helix domain-containing protein [Herbaspirillum sp.]|uniref:helix-turn-helix domain-containing protein n=1 Tax=Herbaspirillum sp. TaxID=1890675 RepID=UPI001B181CB9|nr:helix-turn-helix domain-containing protein [Herbaspirillum sp.]MBO9538746.1 helix-turn-helix domain-containing protein [Herbaspirillum sp.]
MHPEQIKAAMRMAGKTPAMAADDLKVAGSTVSQVISGRAKSARIQAYIAKIIKQPIDKIWPPSDRPVLRRTKAIKRKTI